MVRNSENYNIDTMNNQNFEEWTREQKEEFAKKRMDEMRKKNEELQKRYAEVESDRIAAESRNSAVTVALKSQQKEKCEIMKNEVKPEYAREWDRGKPDKDHLQPAETNSFKSYGPGRYNRNSGRREQSRFNRSSNDYYNRGDSWTTDDRRSDQAQDHRGGQRSNNYEQPQFRGSRPRRGNAHRGNDSFRKPQHFTDERPRGNYHDRNNSAKKNSNRAHSRSPSWSGSDYELRKDLVQQSSTSSANSTALWNNESYKEYQNAQNRVEQWVDNVNKCKPFSQPAVSEKTNQQFSSEKENKKWDWQSNKLKNVDHSSNRSIDDDNDRSPSAVKTSFDFKTSPQKPNIQRTVFCKGTSNDADPAVQDDSYRKRGFKPKFSPESVTAHDRGEQFSRQRSFDNQRYNRDSKYRGNKSNFKNDSRGRSGYGGENNRHEKFMSNRNSNSQTTDGWNQSSDSWGTKEVSLGVADDGIWNNAQQTDVKWKLSDEETDARPKYVMSSKDVEKDTWNDNSEGSNVYQKQNKKSNSQNPDDPWGNVEQSGAKWNERDTRGSRGNTVTVGSGKNRDKASVSRNKNVERDGWHSDQPATDEVDGTWGDVDQSGTKWNLSDSD